MISQYLDQFLHSNYQSIFLSLDHNVQIQVPIFYHYEVHHKGVQYSCVSTLSTNISHVTLKKELPEIIFFCFKTNRVRLNHRDLYLIVVIESNTFQSNNLQCFTIFSFKHRTISTCKPLITILNTKIDYCDSLDFVLTLSNFV